MNTRLVKVKNESELPDIGAEIELEVLDNEIKAIKISGNDTFIKIAKDTTYSDKLVISTPQTAKEKDVYVVAGKLQGIADYESDQFEHEYQALEHLSDLMNKHGDMIGLEVTKKTVSYFEDKI